MSQSMPTYGKFFGVYPIFNQAIKIDDNLIGSKDQAVKYGKENKHQFFFAMDINTTGCKVYGSAPSLGEFYKHYSEAIDQDYRMCFYEMMVADLPIFENYDLDVDFEKIPASDHCDLTPENIFKLFDKLRNSFIFHSGRDVIPNLRKKPDYRVLDSSKPEKKTSLHIMNRNHVWKNMEEMKAWYEDFKEYCILYYSNTALSYISHPIALWGYKNLRLIVFRCI
jgi:hypothetical protein